MTMICCCGAKTLTRIIGWLHLVMSVFFAVGAVYRAVAMVNAAGGQGTKEQVSSSVMIVSVAMGVFAGLYFVVNLLLIIGNEKEKSRLFWPWLIFTWIYVSGGALVVIGSILQGLIMKSFGFATVIFMGGFSLYCVHKRFKELRGD